MPRRASVRVAVCAAACLAGGVLAPSAEGAPPPYSLRQLAVPYECTSETPGECTQSAGRALFGARAIAMSPDGRFVYETADNGSAVGVFRRDRGTGRLLEVSCVSSAASQECQTVDAGLSSPEGVAVSGDGRNVYVASFDSRSVNAYSRDASTGALTPLNCFSNASGGDPGCTNTAVGLSGARGVAVVGNRVYVTGAHEASVTTFSRDPVTGALVAETGCLSSVSVSGCTSTGVHGTAQASGVTASPDGRQLYVAGSNSSAIATFDRAADGSLTFARCVSELHGAFGDPSCGSHAATGIVDPQYIAITRNGRSVYVTGGLADAIAHFERTSATGALTFKDCIAEPRADPISENACTRTGKGLTGAEGLAVTADGRSVYVASPESSAVAAFRRAPSSGRLQQLAPPYNCLTTLGGTFSDLGCGGRAKGLKTAIGVAVPADGRNVYVTGFGSNALASFARTSPPHFAGVKIEVASAGVHKRIAAVSLGCPPASGGCLGRLTLLRKGKSIGSKPFLLGAGKHRAVNVQLSKAAWSKLLSAGSLPVRARVVAQDGFGQPATTSRKLTLHPA